MLIEIEDYLAQVNKINFVSRQQLYLYNCIDLKIKMDMLENISINNKFFGEEWDISVSEMGQLVYNRVTNSAVAVNMLNERTNDYGIRQFSCLA